MSAWLAGRRDIWWVKFNPGRFTRAGVPDYLCCFKGRFYAIELKAGDGGLQPAQMREMERILAAGGVYAICWTLEQVKNVFEAKIPNAKVVGVKGP